MHAFSEYSACVKQITIRQVGERCLEEAKKRAKQRGVPMNTVFRDALAKGLGVVGEKQTNGLERFAADSDFGSEWDAHLDELRRVNPDDWS
jgi:hypothetical protein